MLTANQENFILDICIPNIENSQNTFRYDILEFFNNYLLMWENLEVKGMHFEVV